MDLHVVGDVQTILQGKVTPKTLQEVSVKAMPFALGGTALPDTQTLEIGETIIYEGIGHIFTVKESWAEKNLLQAAFLMGIERKPKNVFKISKSQSIESLYESLIHEYSIGFAIVGKVHFSKLSVAYLKLSPIYDENINILRSKYWNSESLENVEADLFGVVLRKPNPKAFYQNPNEPVSSSLASHTHVLAPLARHLLTDSELSHGTFWIEAIDLIH